MSNNKFSHVYSAFRNLAEQTGLLFSVDRDDSISLSITDRYDTQVLRLVFHPYFSPVSDKYLKVEVEFYTPVICFDNKVTTDFTDSEQMFTYKDIQKQITKLKLLDYCINTIEMYKKLLRQTRMKIIDEITV